MRLPGIWTRSRGGGKVTIVVMVAQIVYQAVQFGMVAAAGDWSQAEDVLSIGFMSFLVLMWVRVAGLERDRWIT